MNWKTIIKWAQPCEIDFNVLYKRYIIIIIIFTAE